MEGLGLGDPLQRAISDIFSSVTQRTLALPMGIWGA